MSFIHTTALDAVPGGAAQKTAAFDTQKVFAGSFAFTLAGATGSPVLTIALEGSDAVPPDGAIPNQPGAPGVNQGWQIPESSWVALGVPPITSTLSANGTARLDVPGTALLSRWVRAKSTPATNTGGTLTIEVYLRDTGS